jgi:bifunctional DNA-binding transcriptional regulator/antitoxin component of YhaV-PrlF toxin-antitoxin module
MNFIEFGPQKFYAGKAPCETPMVTISRIGQIILNEKAVELLKVKPGDNVLVCQDADNKKSWAIKRTKSGGFVLRTIKKDKTPLLFRNKFIVEKILLSHNSSKTEKLPIGDFIEGGYWPIEKE